MTYLTHKDPRYTLPALVYVAVLATFWIATVRRRWLRNALTATVIAIAIINFAGMAFGLGGTQRVMVSLPGAQNTIVFPWQLTVYENWGWVRGAPAHDGNVLALMRGLHKQGVESIGLDGSVNQLDFSIAGIIPVARDAGVGVSLAPAPGPHFAWLLLHTPAAGEPAPCQRLNDGSGVYVVSGPFANLSAESLRDPADPSMRYTFICPGRPSVKWPPAGRSA
jgi:hypothetical protein